MYRIELLPSAARELRKLERAIQVRISRRIERLASDPRAGGARKLSGEQDIWRVRVGDYRILYRISDEKLVVLVIRLAHRRSAYRD